MFKRFLKNEDGNFAIIMALILVPVMGAVGAGYDYSMMANKKVKLQKAADTALFAAAKDAGSNTEFYRLAENYFNANYQGGEIEYHAKAGPKSVSLRIRDRYETAVMGVLGIQYLDMEIVSEVVVDKFGGGTIGLSGSQENKILEELDRAEKHLLQKISDLPYRDQERARKRLKRRFDMLREQISSGASSSQIRLSK